MKRVIFCLLALFVSVEAGYTETINKTWWNTHEEGWFWYIDPPEPEEKEEEAPALPPPAPAPAPAAQSAPTEPEELTAENLRVTGEILMGKAVANPTFENVKTYISYQKKMMDLSQRFGIVWQKVIMQNPDLTVDTDADGKIRKAIASLKDEAGLVFIYTAHSQVSQAMAEVVDMVHKLYGLSVLAVTLDENALPQFPDTRFDNGISATLNVTADTSIYLLWPETKRVEKLGEGFIHQYDLEQRLAKFGGSEETPLELLQAELRTMINANKTAQTALLKGGFSVGGKSLFPITTKGEE